MTTPKYTYLTAAETAKLIRSALKISFPGQKFSVKSNTYSGGASIDVSWTNGPTRKQVKRIISPYNGANFDGMTDQKSYNAAWMTPDGKVTFAEYANTAEETTYYARPHPEAELVQFGADFIFEHRHYTADIYEKVFREICANWQAPEPRYFIGYDNTADFDPSTITDWDLNQKICREARDIYENLDLYTQPNAPAEIVKTDGKIEINQSIVITYDREWTWIKFPEIPSAATRELLKDLLHAKFSAKRNQWYIAERIDATEIRIKTGY